MNKAILIVICDFLVSAMLSMMTGMVPSHTGGTGVGLDENTTQVLLSQLEASRRELERLRRELREAAEKVGNDPKIDKQLRELAAKLADNRLQKEQLEELLKRTVRNTGKLSPEQLKKQLDEEKRLRYQAEFERDERKEQLAGRNADLKEFRQENRQLRQELSDSSRQLREMAQSYTKVQQDVVQAKSDAAQARAEAAGSRRELDSSRKELAERNSDLSEVREALKEMSRRVGQADKQANRLQNTLAYTTGKLSSAQRDLAIYRDKDNRLQKQLSVVILERDEALKNRQEMEKLVRRTVSDLSRTRSDLERAKIAAEKDHKEAVSARAKLQAAETMLADTRKQLQTNVLENYGSAALRLQVAITESRLIIDQQGGGIYYLPLVSCGKSSYIIGHFRTFAGNSETALTFRNITKLEYTAARPGESGKSLSLAGPLMTLPADSRVAALKADVSGVKPLKVIGRAALAKRGIHRLYLFKNRSYGRECAELSGRCSFDLFNGRGSLFIRNASHGTGSELKAEPGDFVLTGEGDFVGVVVSEYSSDIGRRHTAQVYVLEDDKVWENAPAIPIEKDAKNRYSLFAEKVRELNGKITGMELKAKRSR